MLDETLQHQGFRRLGRQIKLRRGLDRGDRYSGKLAENVVRLPCGRTGNVGRHAVEVRHRLSRYPSSAGCSRTLPLMNSSVRLNSALKRSGEIRSIESAQPSGSTRRPVKICLQFSTEKVSS